ncbi:MAG TPA: hypothetical protein VF752_07975 [Thermoleophilaceae bacterium]
MRALPAALALLALAAPAASGFFEPVSRHVDLTGDGKPERVHTVKMPGPGGGTGDLEAQTAVAIADTCGDNQFVTRPQDSLGSLSFPKADTHRGREAFIDLRSGASGRAGSIDLVALRPQGSGCPRPRELFRYSSDHPPRAPRGADGAAGFAAKVRDMSSRFKGRELALSVYFTKPGEPLCCPSIRRTILYRYDSKRDRYVRYAARTTRRPN